MTINLTKFQLMVVLNSPAKIAFRRAIVLTSKGLALRSDSTVRISSTEVTFFPMGITFDLE
jgi:hypothetical protein